MCGFKKIFLMGNLELEQKEIQKYHDFLPNIYSIEATF